MGVRGQLALNAASSYRSAAGPAVYYKPITPTPLSPLLLRGELVRPSVPRLACCPQANTWGLFFVRTVSCLGAPGTPLAPLSTCRPTTTPATAAAPSTRCGRS